MYEEGRFKDDTVWFKLKKFVGLLTHKQQLLLNDCELLIILNNSTQLLT